jgi:hypothetical protein
VTLNHTGPSTRQVRRFCPLARFSGGRAATDMSFGMTDARDVAAAANN